jgi:hypothetical protein
MVQFSVRNRATTLDQPRLPLLPPALTAILVKTARRVRGLAVTALGIGLLLALISYDANDPSLNTAVSTTSDGGVTIRNWLGATGALTADLVLQWLGTITGWMLGLGLVVFGWRLTNPTGLNAADSDDNAPNPSRGRRLMRITAYTIAGVLTLAVLIAPVALGLAMLTSRDVLAIDWLIIGATWQLMAEALNPLSISLIGATGATVLASVLIAAGLLMSVIWAGLRPRHLNLAWQGTTTGGAVLGGMLAKLPRARQ